MILSLMICVSNFVEYKECCWIRNELFMRFWNVNVGIKFIRVSVDSSIFLNEVMLKLGVFGVGVLREISIYVLLLCLLFVMLSIYS